MRIKAPLTDLVCHDPKCKKIIQLIMRRFVYKSGFFLFALVDVSLLEDKIYFCLKKLNTFK